MEPQPRRRFLFCRRPDAVSVFRTDLPQAFSFYRIRAQASPQAIPWRAVAEAAGPLRRRMLLPPGLQGESGVERFEPQILPTKLLFRFALKTLRTLKADPAARVVYLSDPNGLLQNEAQALLPFGSAFYIAAPPGIYEEAARRWLEQSGVAPILCCSLPQNLDARSIVIATSAAAVPFSFQGLLFTYGRGRFPFASVYTPDPPILPAELEARRPQGIDPLLFAAAAAELCQYRLQL